MNDPLNPSPQRSRFGKILLVIAAVAIAASVLAFAGLIYILPSPQTISKFLHKKKNIPFSAKAAVPNSLADDQDPNTNDWSASDQKPETNSQSTETATEKASNQEKAVRAIKDILVEDLKDQKVCDNLKTSQYLKYKDTKKSDEIIIKGLINRDRVDSFTEAFRVPIKAVLQQPDLKSLILEIMDYADQNPNAKDSSFFAKMGFYTKAMTAVQKLMANKSDYEYIANMSEHLATLTKLTAMNPDLANDPAITSFCHQVEDSLFTEEKVDLQKQRNELVALIRSTGTTPEALDFNPEVWQNFDLNLGKDGLKFNFKKDESAH